MAELFAAISLLAGGSAIIFTWLSQVETRMRQDNFPTPPKLPEESLAHRLAREEVEQIDRIAAGQL